MGTIMKHHEDQVQGKQLFEVPCAVGSMFRTPDQLPAERRGFALQPSYRRRSVSTSPDASPLARRKKNVSAPPPGDWDERMAMFADIVAKTSVDHANETTYDERKSFTLKLVAWMFDEIDGLPVNITTPKHLVSGEVSDLVLRILDLLQYINGLEYDEDRKRPIHNRGKRTWKTELSWIIKKCGEIVTYARKLVLPGLDYEVFVPLVARLLVLKEEVLAACRKEDSAGKLWDNSPAQCTIRELCASASASKEFPLRTPTGSSEAAKATHTEHRQKEEERSNKEEGTRKKEDESELTMWVEPQGGWGVPEWGVPELTMWVGPQGGDVLALRETRGNVKQEFVAVLPPTYQEATASTTTTSKEAIRSQKAGREGSKEGRRTKKKAARINNEAGGSSKKAEGKPEERSKKAGRSNKEEGRRDRRTQAATT